MFIAKVFHKIFNEKEERLFYRSFNRKNNNFSAKIDFLLGIKKLKNGWRGGEKGGKRGRGKEGKSVIKFDRNVMTWSSGVTRR